VGPAAASATATSERSRHQAKVASWPLERAQHYVPHDPPEPAIIVAATKPTRVKRTRRPKLPVLGLGPTTMIHRVASYR
jgi:hypothetical protein